MSFSSLDELGRVLVRLKLVEPAQLENALVDLGTRGSAPADLLRVLESRGDLTSYQVSRLGKGATDGLVLGQYKLLYRNAAGSFARVFRGCSLEDGRMVGIKVLRQRWAKDRNSIVQFQREAELCKKLRHKNIVPIYEIGSEGEYQYFTMEFVEGGNLRDFLKIRKRLSPVEATRCVLEMAEGLEYALRLGITHRDLKLTNVLMSAQGVAKLVDFGLAGNDGGSGGSSGDDVQRALEYATLEKGAGAPRDDPRSDLYFLGAIYYELVSGEAPYPPTSDRHERKQITRYKNIRPLSSVDPNIPGAVVQIVERLMKFFPDQRYQSPTEAVIDLRRALQELGGDNAPAGLPTGVANHGNAGSGGNGDSGQPTVMFIENRIKHQDILREYFSKRGFRVLVLTDVDRGLNRLRSNPPDCVVLMGDAIGDGIAAAFEQAKRLAQPTRAITVAILSEKQSDAKAQLSQTSLARVLVQPVTLRDLRGELHLALQKRLHAVK